MQNTKRKSYIYLRAFAVSAFAFLVCWALAQKAQEPDATQPDPKVLLAHQTTLYESDSYPEFLHYSDSILQVLVLHNMRSDWYKALVKKTIGQQNKNEAHLAVQQLIPILQQQVLADSFTAKINGLLAYTCVNSGSYVQGAWYAEQYLAGLIKHQCKKGPGIAYMFLGYALKMQGDYQEAKPYYLASIPLLEREKDLQNLSETYINLGEISRFTGAYEQSRVYYRKAVEIYPPKRQDLEANLGWSYSDEGRDAEALNYFKIAETQLGLYAELARGMCISYEAIGDTMHANFYVQEALKLAASSYDTVKALVYQGDALQYRHQNLKALQCYQSALEGLYPNIQKGDWAQNPKPNEATDFWPIKALQGKAKALADLYSQTQQASILHWAEQSIQIALTALDSFLIHMQNGISSQDALDYTYYTYETGIQTALLLDELKPGQGYLELAYNRAEKAKSDNLKQSLAEQALRQTAKVPNRLLSQEKQLNAEIIYWEELKQADSLLAAVRQLQQVKDTIEQLVPSIQKSRLQTQTVSLAQIQQTLKDKELLLQFFWGNQEVLAFAIDQHQLKCHRFPRSTGLQANLDSLVSALTQWTDPIASYEAKAGAVYQTLCQPVLAQFPQTTRLIVVPDGPLFKIPFEALVRENHRFLAEDVAISYHWSGALWQQARAKAATTSYSTSYGGFAPEYRTKAALASVMGAEVTDLPEAREAVRASGAAWKGQVWTGDTIDEALFLREAGKYGVLHLAMHGVMDPNERTKTGLLFPNQSDSIDLLNALKISQMELHAQIAILSACNTASGKVYRGEGVMSLSRAFALAGCPTVVANLWEVPSQETNAIAAQFLEFLRDGKSKDVALQQAKQAYLASAMPERRHPYFWAGQVLTGHEEPIQQSSKGILFWILMLVLGLILGYGLMVLRRK